MNGLRELHRHQSVVLEFFEAILPHGLHRFGERFIEFGVIAGEEASRGEILRGDDLGIVRGDIQVVEEADHHTACGEFADQGF